LKPIPNVENYSLGQYHDISHLDLTDMAELNKLPNNLVKTKATDVDISVVDLTTVSMSTIERAPETV
jgi:hypothetical protein